jgi:hypothetical protein
MKPQDFITENEFIAVDAEAMRKDNEVQMARQDCFNAAKDAIELHKLLGQCNEMSNLEGWVSEKLTLAADYLNTVREYLEYELISKHEDMPTFSMESASSTLDALLESPNPHNYDSDEDYYNALNAPAKPRYRGTQSPGVNPDDEDYFREIWRKKREAAKKAEQDKGVTEGEHPDEKEDKELIRKMVKRNALKDVEEARVGNRMSDMEIGSPKIVYHKGKAVGEVGIDHEASPGNGPYYMKHYLTGKDMVGYDSKKEALADLKHLVLQHVDESAGCTGAGSVATSISTGKGPTVGSLFGGSYKQKAPVKKAKVIKR